MHSGHDQETPNLQTLGSATCLLKVCKEIKAFLIGDLAEAVIRINAPGEIWHQLYNR